MSNEFTKVDNFENMETHLINIIIMNDSQDAEIIEEDLMHFDFDYH